MTNERYAEGSKDMLQMMMEVCVMMRFVMPCVSLLMCVLNALTVSLPAALHLFQVHNRWSGCSVPNSVAHSLQVRKAMALGDYHMWFILLKTAQNLSGELMQQWADKTRLPSVEATNYNL